MTNEQILKRYRETQHSIAQIARDLGISYSRAYRAIRAHIDTETLLQRKNEAIKKEKKGVPNPTRSLNENEIKKLFALLHAGVTVKKAAQAIATSPSKASAIKRGVIYRDLHQKYSYNKDPREGCDGSGPSTRNPRTPFGREITHCRAGTGGMT